MKIENIDEYIQFINNKSTFGKHTELISLYIAQLDKIKIINKLKSELGQSANIKSTKTRLNVQSALKSILDRLQLIEIPEKGLIIFCGIITIANKELLFWDCRISPQQIYKSVYHCDSEFYLKPLFDMCNNKVNLGMIVADKHEAALGIYDGYSIEVMNNLDSLVPSKTERGGWSQKRYERLRDEALYNFEKKIIDLALESFISINGLLIGGHSPVKEDIINLLPINLQKIIIANKSIGYTNESGLRELIQNCSEELSFLDSYEELNALENFFKLINTDFNKIIYGSKDTLHFLELGKLELLLLSHKNRTSELERLANKYNTKLVIVSNKSELGLQFEKAFGGIGGICRY